MLLDRNNRGQVKYLPLIIELLFIFFFLSSFILHAQDRGGIIITVESVGSIFKEYRRSYPLIGYDRFFGYSVSPDIGYFILKNTAIGIKGVYATWVDNIGGEYPELHGIGAFITYYPSFLSLHVREEVPPFSGKYKTLDFYPFAQFTWTQIDGYFTGNNDFHRTAFGITEFRLIVGLDFRIWKNLRIGGARGVTFFPGIPFYELKWDHAGALSIRYIFPSKSSK